MKRPFAALVTALFLSASLQAQDVPPADTQSFGDWLLQQHRFRDAEREFERQAFERRGQPDASLWLEKALNAAAQDNADFLLTVSRAWKDVPETACLPELFEGHALYRVGNWASVVHNELPTRCSVDLQDEYRYVQGLSWMRLHRGPEAVERFDGLRPESYLKANAQQASQRSANPPEWKHPKTAATLNAVFPGAGYWYAERPQTAVAALLVTGLSGWAAYSSARSGEKGLAVLTSLLGFGWYMGGIYGGARAAEHENQRRANFWIGPFELRK